IPSARANSPEAIPALFRGDARLETKVSVAQKDRPLGEVLTDLGGKLGVRLVAGRETADDKATLFLDERPAAEVLALIARQFDFQWQRNQGGYELTQDLASKAREAKLREQDRAAQIGAIQARMDPISRLAGQPRDRLEARQSELRRLLAAPNLAPAERARLM